jgi:hypothetical protein
MPKSYYADNTTLNSFLRNTAYSPPVSVWMALYTATPSPSGGGTEVSGGGYARQALTFGAPVNGVSSTTLDVVFPVDVSVDWGTVTSYGIFDASTGGNLLYFANLSTSRYIAVGDQMKFPAGQIVASET